MLYIHSSSCISPQGAFTEGERVEMHGAIGSGCPRGEGRGMQRALSDESGYGEGRVLAGPADGIFRAIEPAYDGISANTLRRMSKAVRLGVGAALPLLRAGAPDGILIGTGNGGMEESVKFLRQIIDFNEGLLAPGHFVQSIPNAIASQIGLSSQNRGYNTTYVHKGLGFEHALIDAGMLVKENPGSCWLVGGVDEVSGYHYRIELADGWYKKDLLPGPAGGEEGLSGPTGGEGALSGPAGSGAELPEQDFYNDDSPGSIAGEGAALFLVDDRPEGARAKIAGVGTLHSNDEAVVKARLAEFLGRNLPAGERIDILVSGENGDNRALHWYNLAKSFVGPEVRIARYKHLCGEYPTASAFAVWLACQMEGKHILLYNNHKLTQHSFILLQRFR